MCLNDPPNGILVYHFKIQLLYFCIHVGLPCHYTDKRLNPINLDAAGGWPIQNDVKNVRNDGNPGTCVLIWEYSSSAIK